MFRILSLVYVCITNVFAAGGLLEHWKCSSQNNGETVCQEICGGCQARPHYQGHAKNGSRSVFKVRTYLIQAFFWTLRKKLKAKKTQNSRKKLKTQA